MQFKIFLAFIRLLLLMDRPVTISDDMATQQKNDITNAVATYSKRLMGFIRKRIASKEEAEDILQEVFYQLTGNPDPIRELSAWLFRVARNKIIDWHRKQRPDLLDDIFLNESEDETEFSGWASLISDQNENPENAYLKSLFWETLNKTLDELPADQKQAFVLHEMEGLSFKEIAKQTGQTVNTLITRKRYAVLHLRKRLKNLYDELLHY